MTLFLQILAFTLPSVVVLVAVYLILNKMFKQDELRRNFELQRQNLKNVTPVRLRAYERAILFLERTQPSSILMRQNLTKMNCLQLQSVLLQQVREEFEHNISQQIYISSQAWECVCLAKESLLNLISVAGKQFEGEDEAIKMAEFLVTTYSHTPNPPSQKAIEILKNEVKTIF